MQKTVASLSVLKILCNRSLNLCLYTLTGVHISLFFSHWPHCIFVNSVIMIFIHVDQSTMSGLRLVGTMSCNFSFCPKFTANCQSWLCLNQLSASVTALTANHLRPIFTFTSSVLTFSSAESLGHYKSCLPNLKFLNHRY